jgi:hypothetical protein
LQFLSVDALLLKRSEDHVVLGGIAQKVKVAHLRLCHRLKLFVVAYPGNFKKWRLTFSLGGWRFMASRHAE